jgi:hypothetical protein
MQAVIDSLRKEYQFLEARIDEIGDEQDIKKYMLELTASLGKETIIVVEGADKLNHALPVTNLTLYLSREKLAFSTDKTVEILLPNLTQRQKILSGYLQFSKS